MATLYLDDGSLTLSYRYNKNKHTVYYHPSIVLYTLNFTKEENVLLATHLNKTFQTNFVLSGHPDGHQTLLKLNKQSEVSHLLQIIKPYVQNIPSVGYKTCIQQNIKQKQNQIKARYGANVIIKMSSSNNQRIYSNDEITTLIAMKTAGATDQDIAETLGRTYWSIVYKVKQLRENNHL